MCSLVEPPPVSERPAKISGYMSCESEDVIFSNCR